jgi:hypothetical protein
MAAFPLRICSTLPTVNPPSFARPLLPSTAGCAWVLVGRGIRKMRILGIVALGAALGGCASSSADITPAYVSPVMY